MSPDVPFSSPDLPKHLVSRPPAIWTQLLVRPQGVPGLLPDADSLLFVALMVF